MARRRPDRRMTRNLSSPHPQEPSFDMDTAVSFHFAARSASLDALAHDMRGTLVRPTDPAFEEDRLVWNMAHQGTPLAIVRAADAGDVATAIDYARRTHTEIAVRGGGHSLAGHSSGDEVLVIDTRDMRGLHIDPDQRIAWARAGLTACESPSPAAAHALGTRRCWFTRRR